jgi:sulfur carrier protein
MVELTVNGEPCALMQPMLLSEFLAAHGLQEKMVVVELNREIVPRQRYRETTLQDRDEIEIVQMMAGG